MRVEERTITQVITVYIARDNSEFDNPEDCKYHETILDFRECTIDSNLGPMTEDNYRNHRISFIKEFYEDPETNVHTFFTDRGYKYALNMIINESYQLLQGIDLSKKSLFKKGVPVKDVIVFLYDKCGLKGTDVPMYAMNETLTEETLRKHQLKFFRKLHELKEYECLEILFKAGFSKDIFQEFINFEVHNKDDKVKLAVLLK